ncbi:MAG: hypothetical protein IKJ77_02230 [Firmicutes bacterium]|nr:hypothetical protein [Bacillota bacterium]
MISGKRVFGLFLICISIAGFVFWEQWGKERILYDEILVLRQNVEKGTIITEDMLDVRKLDFDEPCLSFAEGKELVGMQAAAFIHKGSPLFAAYFQEPDLSPDESKNRYGMCLPTDWITSRPTALSRGDKVFLFFGKRMVTEADVVEVTKDGAVEIIVGKTQAADICQVTEAGGRLALVYQ